MQKLNLPAFEVKLIEKESKYFIFDLIRKKYVSLSPEEWVRQHLINYLVTHLQYPKGLFRIEKQHAYNEMARRSDILILDQQGKPWMLAECKAPEVKLANSSLQQLAIYNKTLLATYLVLCNGLELYCWKAGDEHKPAQLLDELPVFGK
ncbi:MAG TPA: type I restriction enzyme HsdR N-terminal domain-containing protein [Cyclobacteriaceae bacterium]|nr:type I restriction enzyme HsdR N-terminal domain-containing protein [Cyclobacteriaceae bacterium]